MHLSLALSSLLFHILSSLTFWTRVQCYFLCEAFLSAAGCVSGSARHPGFYPRNETSDLHLFTPESPASGTASAHALLMNESCSVRTPLGVQNLLPSSPEGLGALSPASESLPLPLSLVPPAPTRKAAVAGERSHRKS